MPRALSLGLLGAIGLAAPVASWAALRQRSVGLTALALLLWLLVATCIWVLMLRWRNPPVTRAMRQAGHAGPIEWVWAPYAHIAPAMRLAAPVAEDLFFPQHRGFDWHSMRNAYRHNRRRAADDTPRGGSTISQQVAKNVFLWPAQSYARKVLEVWFTILIETCWPKQRILEVYLNVAQFGPLTFGVQAAAQRFFGKTALQLTQQEAALLAAVLPNPVWIYRADAPSPQLRFRQVMIMNGMKKAGERYLALFEARS